VSSIGLAGRFNVAVAAARRAIETREELLGPEHTLAGNSLATLAKVLDQTEDLDATEKTYARIISIRRAHRDTDEVPLAESLADYGALLLGRDQFEACRSCLREAREIFERRSQTETWYYCALLTNEAVALRRSGMWEEAERSYSQALAIHRKIHSADDSRSASVLVNLAEPYREQGRLADSDRMHQILDGIEQRAGEVPYDLRLRRGNRGLLRADQGRYEEALDDMLKSAGFDDRQLGEVFTFASPEHMLRQMREIVGHAYALLSLLLQRFADQPDAARLAHTLILRRKAVVQDSLAAARQSREPTAGARPSLSLGRVDGEAVALAYHLPDGYATRLATRDVTMISEMLSESVRHGTLRVRLNALAPMLLKVEASCKSDFLSGQTSFFAGPIDLRITPSELNEAYDSIRSAAQQSPSRRGSSALLDPVKDLGARLFNALFQSGMGRVYNETVSVADERGWRLRISISATKDSLVEELPWEFLYDPLRNDFLALSMRRPILRQIERSPPKDLTPRSTSPLRAAFLSSPDPNDTLATDRDRALLEQISRTSPRGLEVFIHGHVSRSEFVRIVASNEYDVIHFAGHAVEPSSESIIFPQMLMLQGPDGRADLLHPQMLMDALKQQHRLRLLYLNACNSHRLARLWAEEIPNVVSIRALVSIDFCVDFARGFYQALLTGVSVEEAMSAARQLSDTVNPGGREWGMAVLCTHLPSPDYLTGRAQRSEPQAEQKSDAVPASPTNAREWEKLLQLRELNRRNLSALRDRLESLASTEETHEAVRTISQGYVDDLRGQIAKLEDVLKDLERRMQALH
jgi:tetratricopeptide (TPR) repeat protein